MQLTAFQHAILVRARDGEDRMLPARLHSESGRLPYVVPARRWFVPKGYIVPSGGNEYAACRTLTAMGLLSTRGVPVSPENPYGLGGYSLTPLGSREVEATTPVPLRRRPPQTATMPPRLGRGLDPGGTMSGAAPRRFASSTRPRRS